jgi:hypothetical protein
LPKFATIVDLVVYHECLEEPAEIDLKAVANEPLPIPGKDKFVKKLYDLNPAPPSSIGSVGTDNLRDRRFEKDPDTQAKSTAPLSILSHIKTSVNSSPAHDLEEPPESED